ncbi:MAG TPA: arginine deiminase family protein [Thermoanaerobaculia bacterium]|nr:arginine deiminase family protein [Thermoanaerobaculia bacterium]
MIAVTFDVIPSIANCELTHVDRVPISYERAREQHAAYREVLASLGCEVIDVPGDAAYPDCVFVEDTAVVLSDVAVITRPGAESRRGETRAIAGALAPYRRLVHIEAPATLDGGDVLVLDDTIYVGLSSRSNESALVQLRALTGREVIGVNVHGALHLKTAITRVAADALLVNREWLDVAPFANWRLIDVDPREPFGANALLVNERVIYPRAFPHTAAKLQNVTLVDADELAKAEGGVTCCALLVV